MGRGGGAERGNTWLGSGLGDLSVEAEARYPLLIITVTENEHCHQTQPVDSRRMCTESSSGSATGKAPGCKSPHIDGAAAVMVSGDRCTGNTQSAWGE